MMSKRLPRLRSKTVRECLFGEERFRLLFVPIDAYVVGIETTPMGALTQVCALVGDGEVLVSFAKRNGA